MRISSRIEDASEGNRSAGLPAQLRDGGLRKLFGTTRVADTLHSASNLGTQRGSGSCSGGKRWMTAGGTR